MEVLVVAGQLSLVSVVLSDHPMNEETHYASEFDDLDPGSSQGAFNACILDKDFNPNLVIKSLHNIWKSVMSDRPGAIV